MILHVFHDHEDGGGNFVKGNYKWMAEGGGGAFRNLRFIIIQRIGLISTSFRPIFYDQYMILKFGFDAHSCASDGTSKISGSCLARLEQTNICGILAVVAINQYCKL